MIARKIPGHETNGDNAQLMPSLMGLTQSLVGVLVACVITVQSAWAEEEWRVGGMLQIPFGGSKEQSFVHFANTRIGVKVQYAEIDDVIKRNEQTVDRVYQDGVLQSSTVTSAAIVTVDEGDQVIGGEGYLMVAPFNGFWDVSGGLNGFAGQQIVQGAAGLGYDPSFGVYLGLGALLPYSQAGIRLNFRHLDYFVGATSLPKFSSKTIWKEDKINYKDTSLETPAESALEVEE